MDCGAAAAVAGGALWIVLLVAKNDWLGGWGWLDLEGMACVVVIASLCIGFPSNRFPGRRINSRNQFSQLTNRYNLQFSYYRSIVKVIGEIIVNWGNLSSPIDSIGHLKVKEKNESVCWNNLKFQAPISIDDFFGTCPQRNNRRITSPLVGNQSRSIIGSNFMRW